LTMMSSLQENGILDIPYRLPLLFYVKVATRWGQAQVHVLQLYFPPFL
jgi:hypothetical protein